MPRRRRPHHEAEGPPVLLRLFLSVFFLWVGCVGGAHALTSVQALRIAQGDSDARIAALNEVVVSADTALDILWGATIREHVVVRQYLTMLCRIAWLGCAQLILTKKPLRRRSLKRQGSTG